jgi:hypothetical protein
MESLQELLSVDIKANINRKSQDGGTGAGLGWFKLRTCTPLMRREGACLFWILFLDASWRTGDGVSGKRRVIAVVRHFPSKPEYLS